MRSDRAFTLIEIIVVIVIILVLAGVLVPAVMRARRKGRETECMSNMKQLHLALQMHRDSHINRGKALNPEWLNSLIWDNPGAQFPKNLMKQELVTCPLDDSEGKEGGKPANAGERFSELNEYQYFKSIPTPVERPCSYMYEFNMARRCTWVWKSRLTLPGDSEPGFDYDAFVKLDNDSLSDWGEVKTAQMRYGDTFINQKGATHLRGYAPSRFPVLRCFWHTDKPDTNRPKILNLSYEGQTFRSGAFWEEYAIGK